MCCRRRGGPSRPRSPPQPARSAPSPAGGAPLPEPPPVPPQPRGAPRLERGRGAKRGGPGGQGAAPGSGGARPNPPVPGHLGSARASPAGAVCLSSGTCEQFVSWSCWSSPLPDLPLFFPPCLSQWHEKKEIFRALWSPPREGRAFCSAGCCGEPRGTFLPWRARGVSFIKPGGLRGSLCLEWSD